MLPGHVGPSQQPRLCFLLHLAEICLVTGLEQRRQGRPISKGQVSACLRGATVAWSPDEGAEFQQRQGWWSAAAWGIRKN